jgi:N-acetylmuramoyl-L-alanine amidase
MTRSTFLGPLSAAFTVLLALASPSPAQTHTARTRYADAQARETAVRTTIEESPAADQASTGETLGEARKVIAAYEAIVRRHPISGYSDNALFNGAALADTLHQKFGQARDRDAALRLYRRVEAEYPTSSLIRSAADAIARLETVAPSTEAKASTSVAATAPRTESATAVKTPASSSSPSVEAAKNPASSVGSGPAAGGRAKLTNIDRVVLTDTVRVTLTLDREVQYREETLAGPARVFFDLRGVETTPELTDAVLRYPSDLVRQIRVGRHPNSTIRVVLDMEGAGRHSIYTLYNPFRLVIDCDTATGTAAKAAEVPAAEATITEPVKFTVVPADEKPIAASARTVKPSALLMEPLPVLVMEPPAGPAAPDSKVAVTPRAAPTPPAAPTPATSRAMPPAPVAARATTPPADATPAPEAANANSVGGFSLSRQLGLGVSRIVIDPGHGGHDPGAQGKGLNESELTLDIALRLEELLKKEPGVEVVLTRRTDEYIPLEERTSIANRESADLFLSIHANASRNAVARGVETYFLSFAATPEAEAVAARENSAHAGEMHKLPDMIKAIALNNKLDESRDLAAMVQEAMVTRLRRSNRDLRNLGVKKAPFVVLIGAGMPSVLAEVSFLTNKQELQLLKTPAYKDRIAEALHAAVMRYRRSLKGSSAIASQ